MLKFRHLFRGFKRFEQTAAAGFTRASEIQCRAMINRCSDNRQASGDIHALTETRMF